MDRNFFFALALSFLVLTLWTLYQEDKRQDLAEQLPAASETAPGPIGETPAAPAPGQPPAPIAEAPPATAPPPVAPAPAASPDQPEELISLGGRLWNAQLTSRGGALRSWVLEEYDDAYASGRPKVQIASLIDDERAFTTPLDDLGFGDLSAAHFDSEQPDSNTLVFTRIQDGVTIRKTYSFDPDSYLFGLRIEVENESTRHVRPGFRVAWPVATPDEASIDFRELAVAAFADGDLEQEFVGSGPSGGGFFFGGGGGFDELREFPRDVDWAGANARYFLAAIIPDVPRDAGARFVPGGRGSARTELAFQPVNVPPGQSAAREYRVYLGPKESSRLDAVGAHLDESISKGWFAPLTDFFTRALEITYSFVGNYGVAIILVTLIVRLAMYPIMQRQMKSMKRMSGMQPKIKEMQEQYADDKEKQSQEMMKIYRESGFNPLTGCLPMFLQLPVFIGLYFALQGAIELRQAPFFGWISDLSVPETLFMLPGLELPVRLLPLLMGGSMVLQTRMTPTTMDPAQARMMNTVMPVMFTFLFYQFASGLVLYWLVSNLLGIGQQLITNRSKDA